MHFHLLMQLLLALLINHAEDKILNDVVAPVDLISSLFFLLHIIMVLIYSLI